MGPFRENPPGAPPGAIALCSPKPLNLHQVYHEGVYDFQGVFHKVSVLVLKPATRQEYLDCLREHGQPNPERNAHHPFYYWVQMD